METLRQIYSDYLMRGTVQEEYDDEPMGYCSLKNDRYIGSMDNIYTGECDCLNIPE